MKRTITTYEAEKIMIKYRIKSCITKQTALAYAAIAAVTTWTAALYIWIHQEVYMEAIKYWTNVLLATQNSIEESERAMRCMKENGIEIDTDTYINYCNQKAYIINVANIIADLASREV